MILRLIVAGQDVIPRTTTPYVAYHTIDFTLDNRFNFSNVAVISAEIIPDPEPQDEENIYPESEENIYPESQDEENTDGQ